MWSRRCRRLATILAGLLIVAGLCGVWVFTRNYEQKLIQHPFFEAAYGPIEGVERYLQRGGDVNKTEWSRDSTMLHLAAANGQFDIVKLLLRHGADVKGVTHYGDSALDEAARERYTNIVECLRNAGAPYTLQDAVRLHDLPGAKSILEKDPGQIALVATRGLFNKCDLEALSTDPNMLRLLLDHSFDPSICSRFGTSLSYLAIANGNREVIQVLIDHKFDFALGSPETQRALSELHAKGQGDTLELLLRLGK